MITSTIFFFFFLKDRPPPEFYPLPLPAPLPSAVPPLPTHPAVLMWMVGNEWNRNSLFHSCAGDACYSRVNEIARDIKRLDPAHPVATSFAPTGDLPTTADLQRLDAVDVWKLNVYSQPGFFARFQNWRLLALQLGVRKPFFMSEYGT